MFRSYELATRAWQNIVTHFLKVLEVHLGFKALEQNLHILET